MQADEIFSPAEGFASKEDAAAFIATQANNGGNDASLRVILRAILQNEALRQQAYRQAARKFHPDAPTGNHELFVKLQQAFAMLEKQG